MLKLKLQPGEGLDRHLEAAGKALSRLAEQGVKEGYLRIVAYPNPDPVTAAIYLAAKLTGSGVRVAVSVTTKPPPVLAPTLLLGFDSANYKQADLGYEVVAIGSGEVRGQALPGLTIVEVEGSVSAAAAMIAGELSRVGASDETLLALAGSLLSRYVERTGRFHGLDRLFIDSLAAMESLNLEVYTGFKAFKPHRYSVCRSLSVTSDPYYPGITGDEDYCLKLLEAQDLQGLAGRALSSLDEEDLKRLFEVLDEEIFSQLPVDPVNYYLGGIPVADNPGLNIQDVREAATTVIHIGDIAGLPGLAALALDLENEYPPAEASLERFSSRLAELMIASKPRRLKAQLPFRLVEVDAERRDSLTILWRALQATGKTPSDTILVVDEGDELRASAFQVEDSLGYGSVKRLVETRRARLEGLTLWLGRNAGQ